MRRHQLISIAIICLGMLFCSFGILGVITPVSAAEPAAFSSTSAAGQVGDSVEIQISLSDVTAMAGGSFNLYYDPQLLKPLQVQSGDFLNGYLFIPNPDYSSNGKAVRVVWAKATGSSGSGNLCTITFKLLKNGQAKLEIANCELIDTQKQAIPCASAGGTITITGGSDETTNSSSSGNQSATDTTGSSGASSGTTIPIYTGSQSSGGGTGTASTTNSAASNNTTTPENQNAAIQEQPGALTDITQHWAKSDIEKLVAKGVLHGYADATFKPDQAISRAEFTLMLSQALQLSLVENETSSFKDWEQTPSWAQAGISAAVKAGIIKGYADGNFRPDQLINRSEMAVMIVNALQQKSQVEVSSTFADNALIPDWAKTAVAQGVEAGLITGKGANLFNPTDQATRAESACMVVRLLEK